MSNSASGKTVFVAGGARGIGLGIVRALAAVGFDVCFSYRSSPGEAEQIRDDLRASYPDQTITSQQVDLSDREQVDSFADTIGEAQGCDGKLYLTRLYRHGPVSYTHLRAHETVTLISYAVFCVK